MPRSSSKQKITRTCRKGQETTTSLATAASSSNGRHSYRSQVDEATLRASRVPEDSTVSKTRALQEYRLIPRDLDGLAFTKKRVMVSGYPLDMFLYNEREVERRAWERRGGPERFDAYLKKLRERHAAKNGVSTPFVQPTSYGGPSSATRARARARSDTITIPEKNPMCIYPNVVPPWEHYDEAAVCAERARIQQAMPAWLWDACTHALDELYQADDSLAYVLSAGGRWDELTPMQAALAIAPIYPARPSEPLPSSPSIDRLRAVLASAGRVPEYGVGYGKTVDGLVDHHLCWPDQVNWYDWGAGFLERLFAAILEVVKEHGIGADGWESVRWEVYDKYVESLDDGLKYISGNGTWSDRAAQWLDGRLVGSHLDESCRGQCASGRAFNSMLQTTPAGRSSVGVLCRYGLIPEMYYQ